MTSHFLATPRRGRPAFEAAKDPRVAAFPLTILSECSRRIQKRQRDGDRVAISRTTRGNVLFDNVGSPARSSLHDETPPSSVELLQKEHPLETKSSHFYHGAVA